MFDIGFSELMLIALVGLIVIGPERMPKVARTVGHLLGRLQRYVGDVKADIKREMQLDELKKMQADMAAQAYDMENRVNEQMRQTETSLHQSIMPPGETTAAEATADKATALPAVIASGEPSTRNPPPA